MLNKTQLVLNVSKTKMYKLVNAVCPELVSCEKMKDFKFKKAFRDHFYIFECISYKFTLMPFCGEVWLRCKTFENSDFFNKAVDFELLKELSFFK